MYDFTVYYECGRNTHVANALSRAYLPFEGDDEDDLEFVTMVSYLPISNNRIYEIKAETKKDQSLRSLSETILKGRPEEKKFTPELTHPDHFDIRDELTVQDEVIFKGNAVVIPKNLRAELKTRIRSSHLGIESCLKRALEYIHWPGMSS